jgi:hypothetical protein
MSEPRLMNGTAAPRVKATEGVTFVTDTGKPDGVRCGCAHLEREWLQMCDAHYAEWHARHVEALAPRLMTIPNTEVT